MPDYETNDIDASETSVVANKYAEDKPPYEPPGEDVIRLQGALQKERALRKQFEKQAKNAAGFDVAEYESLRAERDSREETEAARRGEFDKLIGAERKKTADAEQRYKTTLAKAQEAAVDAALSGAFSAAGGKPEHLDNFKILAKAKLSKSDDGYIIPDTYTADDGEPLSDFNDFAKHVRDKGGLGFAFSPVSQAKGSGSMGGKAPNEAGVKYVTPAEAGKHLDAIAKGEVVVR